MKKISLILTTVLFSVAISTVAQDHVDKITESTCSCIGEIKGAPSDEELKVKMGLCMISAAEPYKKQLLKKNGIDMNDLASPGNDNGTKLGQLIGVRMAGTCPDILMKVSSTASKSKNESNSVLGKITSVSNDQFVIIKLKNSTSETAFLWLDKFDNSTQIESNLESLVGKTAEISYIDKALFDAKSKEYVNFKIIQDMFVK